MGVQFKQLDIDLIGYSPLRPKRAPATPSPELVRSLVQHGVTDVVTVRPSPQDSTRYELVKGEAVWIAAQRAAIYTLPCAIRGDLSDTQAADLIAADYRLSNEPDPITEAECYQALMDREKVSKAEIARRFGKTRTVVSKLLGLLQLDPWVKGEIRAGRLDYTHARILANDRLSHMEQRQLAEKCIKQRVTSRQLETMVSATIEGLPPEEGPASSSLSSLPRTQKNKDREIVRLEERLGELIGCPVELDHHDGAGELRIRYANLDVLGGVLERLGYESN